jgi:hypothetical protein
VRLVRRQEVTETPRGALDGLGVAEFRGLDDGGGEDPAVVEAALQGVDFVARPSRNVIFHGLRRYLSADRVRSACRSVSKRFPGYTCLGLGGGQLGGVSDTEPEPPETVVGAAAFTISVTAEAAGIAWEDLGPGVVQEKLGVVVSFIDRARLIDALSGDDRITAEAFKENLGRLLGTEGPPPKAPVVEILQWFARKTDTSWTRRPRALAPRSGWRRSRSRHTYRSCITPSTPFSGSPATDAADGSPTVPDRGRCVVVCRCAGGPCRQRDVGEAIVAADLPICAL